MYIKSNTTYKNGQPILIKGVDAYTYGVTAELINLKVQVRSNSHCVPPYCHELTGKVSTYYGKFNYFSV